MDEELLNRLAALYNQQDVNQLENLLNRDGGFCLTAQEALVEVFVEMQDYDIPVETIQETFEVLWNRCWKEQSPGGRGNPEILEDAGVQNTAALERFYLACGIHDSPLKGFPVDLSTLAFDAVLMAGVYSFGTVESDGFRTVNSEVRKLSFGEGKITQLVLGKSVWIQYQQMGLNWQWFTDPLLEIK